MCCLSRATGPLPCSPTIASKPSQSASGGTTLQDGGHGKVNTRVIIAMCRFFIVSAIWLGLVGAAEPVLACAMNSPASECCPMGEQSACTNDSEPAGAIRDAHQQYCASAPIGEMLAVSIQASGTKLSPGASGAGDLPLITAPADGFPVFSAALANRPHFVASAPSFGALTYLRTGRLRL